MANGPRLAQSLDEQTRALALAAHAQCDPRTALRALREGVEAIHVLGVRERLRGAMAAMKLSGG